MKHTLSWADYGTRAVRLDFRPVHTYTLSNEVAYISRKSGCIEAMAVAAFRSGYSGKSLPEKLGFKAGMNAAFIALPAEHAGLADCTPFAKVVRADHWNARLSPKAFDAIHAFTTRHAELAANLINQGT